MVELAVLLQPAGSFIKIPGECITGDQLLKRINNLT